VEMKTGMLVLKRNQPAAEAPASETPAAG
jgi:hypothetical protein